jgi:hypothetical protein
VRRPRATHFVRLISLFRISTDIIAVDKILSWYLC